MSDFALELPKAASAVSLEVAKRQIQAETLQKLAQVEASAQTNPQFFSKYASSVDLHDSVSVVRYGEPLQKKLRTFTAGAARNAISRDIGEIGGLLTKMSDIIWDFDEGLEVKILGIFRSARKLETLQLQYTQTVKTLGQVQKELDGCRMRLLVDLKTLDEMFTQILEYYQELTACIAAGRQQLEAAQNFELPALRQKSQATGNTEDAMEYFSFKDKCTAFSRRLEDLELTKTACSQTALQNQLAQSTNQLLVTVIQSSICNAIAIWQQNIATALTAQANREALRSSNTTLLTSIQDAQKVQMTAHEHCSNLAIELTL